MPARKPSPLIVRHETAAEQAERAAKEAAVRPRRALPSSPPAQLQDHQVAQIAWRYLLRRFGELEGEIVTSLDLHLVVNMCLGLDELAQLRVMREKSYQVWLQLAEEHGRLVDEGYVKDAVVMAVKVMGAFDTVVKLDSRIDRKVDLLHRLGQSLYLTPRARAGVAPTKKEPEPPPDDLELLLDDVSNFVNGGANQELAKDVR